MLRFICLNRTFYGIETIQFSLQRTLNISLNRTFYGIETAFNRQSAL